MLCIIHASIEYLIHKYNIFFLFFLFEYTYASVIFKRTYIYSLTAFSPSVERNAITFSFPVYMWIDNNNNKLYALLNVHDKLITR